MKDFLRFKFETIALVGESSRDIVVVIIPIRGSPRDRE